LVREPLVYPEKLQHASVLKPSVPPRTCRNVLNRVTLHPVDVQDRRRSEPPAWTSKTTNRGVSDPPISRVRPFMPRSRGVAHAPRAVSRRNPAAAEPACPESDSL